MTVKLVEEKGGLKTMRRIGMSYILSKSFKYTSLVFGSISSIKQIKHTNTEVFVR